MTLEPPLSSPFVTFGMTIVPLVVVCCVLAAMQVATKRAGLSSALVAMLAMGLCTWMTLMFLASNARVFARIDSMPPALFIAVAMSVATWIALALTTTGAAVARAIPISGLIAFHAFRFPLELVMHQAAQEGIMPTQMTWSGLNYDVVTGASAFVLAGLAQLGFAPRALLLAWNAMGTILLLAIMGISAVSLPPILAFGREPDKINGWVAFAPFVWLPTVVVGAALAGHLVLWRRLLERPKEPSLSARPGS